MSAAKWPPIVQPGFGLGNLISAQWLAPRGLRGQAATEDIEMFARKGLFSSIGRTAVMATVAAMALTAVEPSPARAGSAATGKGMSAAAPASDATDFSARRRYYRGGGGAAAAAAFAGIVGTGIAIAASQNRRDDYYYGGAPAYYGESPYYGGTPYYGGYGGYGYRSGVPYFNGHPNAGW
jgi:hypothetical protein